MTSFVILWADRCRSFPISHLLGCSIRNYVETQIDGTTINQLLLQDSHRSGARSRHARHARRPVQTC